ncbi:hypothetical protein [Natronobeatus ordinarius]|uniref:hypothetical protein n=1 Tax=Natronobeatus ordinarius TaxID=2963433 RepID=UPI0020CB6CE4|nr:hypothetical protein [Natronobeatus ordinarius]
MVDSGLKLELVKLNLIVFGATISAITLNVEYYELHIVLGTLILGITAFLQYLSIMPEFAILSKEENVEDLEERDRKLNEWYMLLGSGAYIFLLFGFAYPHTFSGSSIGAALPFVMIIAMYLWRMYLLKLHPTREASLFDSAVLVLLIILISLLTFGVIGIL